MAMQQLASQARRLSARLFEELQPFQEALRPKCPCRFFAHEPDRLKVWKPTSPGQRGRITVDRYNLWKGRPFKALTEGLAQTGGRNNSGRISVWHKGGGAKRLYRRVDFLHRHNVEGVVERIEYDPNRSARIALVRATLDGQSNAYVPRYKYIIAPEGVGAGDTVGSMPDAPIKPGMTLALHSVPTGTVIHNVELRPGSGAKMCRSAGTSATLVKNEEDGYTIVRLPSGEMRKVLNTCKATIGTVGNALHKNRKLGKAGISRHLGIRPTTRALAMNPRDHPASGKNKKLRKTPWGKLFMGVKTRDKSKPGTRFILLSRHKAKELKK